MGDNEKEFFDGLLLGALAGAGIAMLFTPVTGEKARSFVSDRINGIKDIDDAVSSIEEGIERLSMAAEAAKQAAQDKRKELDLDS